MSTPIYTDKEYLDLQFRTITLSIAGLDKKIEDYGLASMARTEDHNRWHRRWGRRTLSIAAIGVSLAGIIVALPH